MAANSTALRSRVEQALAGRIAAPFTFRDRKTVTTVSTGIPEIDSLTGGLPRGALTEIFGPSCSGRTSLLLSALNARTARHEACALIDGADAFDPHSAEAAGVELKKLLWVRCHNIEQALRATDLLLQGGGFGLIAVDLSDIPPRLVRHIPLESWYRFRRAVEDTPTILVFLAQESNAKTCAALGLRLKNEATNWPRLVPTDQADFIKHSYGWLFGGLSASCEVSRSRIQAAAETYPAMDKTYAEQLLPPRIQEPAEAHRALDKTYSAGEVFEFERHGMPRPQLVTSASRRLLGFASAVEFVTATFLP
jgi:recombination protein RecA